MAQPLGDPGMCTTEDASEIVKTLNALTVAVEQLANIMEAR